VIDFDGMKWFSRNHYDCNFITPASRDLGTSQSFWITDTNHLNDWKHSRDSRIDLSRFALRWNVVEEPYSSNFLRAPQVSHLRADEEKAARTMVKITKLPPGKAIGADDLQIWARQRNGGLSGVPDDRQQKNRLHQKQWRARWLRLLQGIARDQWLFRLIAAGRKLDPENKRLAVHLLETLVRHLQADKTKEPSGE
jgi:hypothetical protein